MTLITSSNGLRPPKEILLMEKEHVNLTDRVKRLRGDKLYMIPPHSILVLNGKDKTTRMIPLNSTAEAVFEVLCGDETTGRWLFAKDGLPIKSIKKGFARACERAGIDDLRPYDLRHAPCRKKRPPSRYLGTARPCTACTGFRLCLTHHARLRTCHMGRHAKSRRFSSIFAPRARI
jgi:integrase